MRSFVLILAMPLGCRAAPAPFPEPFFEQAITSRTAPPATPTPTSTLTLMQAPSSPPGPPVWVVTGGDGPRAVVVTHRWSGAVIEVILPSPATLGVQGCATPASRPGVGQVAVSLEPTGTVSRVEVTGPFTASEIACIEERYAPVRSNAFKGNATVAHAFVSLVPEALPSWATP